MEWTFLYFFCSVLVFLGVFLEVFILFKSFLEVLFGVLTVGIFLGVFSLCLRFAASSRAPASRPGKPKDRPEKPG